MLHAMSARQFEEWQVFYRQNPWGEDRADLRSGLAASTLANILRHPKQQPFKVFDFMPFVPKPDIGDAEIEQKIERFMQRYPKH